jgi:hypothetical protein
MSASRLSLLCPTGIVFCTVLVGMLAGPGTTLRALISLFLVFGLACFTIPLHDIGHVLVFILR